MIDVDDDRERSRGREEPRGEDPPREEFKVFVGGISWQLDDYKLKEVFEECHPVDAKVMVDKLTQRSRGFGFVWFADETTREAAIDKYHNMEVEGRRISVSKAVPQSQTAPGTPADALRRGHYIPREEGRYQKGGSRGGSERGYDRGAGGGYDRGGYDRNGGGGGYGGGGYGSGYDRSSSYGGYGGGGGGGGGYERGGYSRGGGYAGYERGGYEARSSYGDRSGGYDRGAYAGYEQYRPDPYAGPPAAPYAAPAGGYYDPRAPPAGYSAPAPQPYEDRYRGAYGADRHDRGGRPGPGPYDRPSR